MTASSTQDVTLTHDASDAEIVTAVVNHHDAILNRIDTLTKATTEAVAANSNIAAARDALVDFCRNELAPHAAAEESTLYVAAAGIPGMGLLIQAMIADHGAMVGLVDELAQSTQPAQIASLSGALRSLVPLHMAKENELVLPSLAADPGVSLAELVDGLHEIVGGEEAGGHGSCGCNCAEDAATPELDVRQIPHAIRHATVFGALESIPPGGEMILIAHHEPVPLLAQIDQRWPGEITVSYDERGPETWRLRLVRA